MNPIKFLGRKLLYLIRCYHWHQAYLRIVKYTIKDNFVIDVDWVLNGKILLIVPHADDELLSSFTLLKYSRELTIYYCGFTGSNKDESNCEIRRYEIYNVCKKLNLKIIDGEGKCDNLKDVLKRGFSSIVFPSIIDWHSEHRKISYMLYDILQELGISPSLYMYSVTVPNESKKQISCFPLTRQEQVEKYLLFKEFYKSQSHMPIYRFIINERINGYYIQSYAAETFCKVENEEWLQNVVIFKKTESMGSQYFTKITSSLSSINDLERIRETSMLMYNCFENRELNGKCFKK